MIKLSPSLLESYRLFRTEDWFTQEKIIESISGEFIPTPAVKLGLAYHEMIETFTTSHMMYIEHGNPGKEELTAECSGYRFAYEPCVKPVLDFLKAGCMHEVSGEREFPTSYGPVMIRTRADAVLGNIGGEWKTTSKSIQIAKYMDSAQWKLCAWTLGLAAMDYRVVQLYVRKDGIVDVKNSDHIQMIWNDSLLVELSDLIHGLIDLHYQLGLEEYLKPFNERKKVTV